MPNIQTSHPQPPQLRYTNVPFEIFICVLTFLPFFVLAYFYSDLPARVPLFLNLEGEVSVWAKKTLLSVFRVPLMALLTQVICSLMRYGAVPAVRRETSFESKMGC